MWVNFQGKQKIILLEDICSGEFRTGNFGGQVGRGRSLVLSLRICLQDTFFHSYPHMQKDRRADISATHKTLLPYSNCPVVAKGGKSRLFPNSVLYCALHIPQIEEISRSNKTIFLSGTKKLKRGENTIADFFEKSLWENVKDVNAQNSRSG